MLGWLKSKVPEMVKDSQAAQLLYWSFWFSQGNIGLQRDILSYVRRKSPKRRVFIQTKVMKAVHEKAMRLIPNMHPGVGYEGDDEGRVIRDASREMARVMRDTMFFKPEKEEPHILLERIVRRMIARDNRFLGSTGYQNKSGDWIQGRQRKNETIRSVHDDPWISFVGYYILQEKKAPMPEYDQLMLDLKSTLDGLIKNHPDAEKEWDGDWKRQLKENLKVFLEKSPFADRTIVESYLQKLG